jgi:hypothetical protein
VFVLNRQHTLEGMGNIVSRTSETGSTTYPYDAPSRLTDAGPPVPQTGLHFTCDAAPLMGTF